MRDTKFSLALLAVFASSAAWSQQPTGDTASGLEEVVVTAERRAENLQATPVTITAINAEQLADLGVTSTQDIVRSVPNIQILPLTANPSTFQIGLRGGVEQTGGLIVSEPVVGMYVDDVYRARLQGANMQLSDVERIEILRGPQGTLYGRNTFSGAIKIVTRTPSQDNSWGDFSVSRGSFAESVVQGSIGGGISDTLGASFAVLYRDMSEGWIFNRAQNRDIGEEKNLSLRGKLAFENGPWSGAFTVAYGKDENDGYIPAAIRFVPPTIPSGRADRVTSDQAAPRFGNDAYIAEYPQPSRGETKSLAATLSVEREMAGFTLRSITGYVDLDDFFRWDIAAGSSPTPGVFAPTFDRQADAQADQFTQELQALGTAAGGRLDWIAGLYYFTEQGDQTITDNIPIFFLFNLAPTFLTMDTDSWAVFGQLSWKFGDRSTFTLGGRYSEDDKKFSGDIQSGFSNPVPRTQVSLARKFSSFTPKLGFDLQFTDDVLGFFSASKGFKAGGFNGLAVVNPTVFRTTYGPQNVYTYEAGVKAEWLNRRLRTNVSVFYNDISDLQQTANVGAGSFAQQNIGDATISGLEAEITARPVQGLDLFATIGLMDGKYDRISPTSQAFTAGAKDLPLVTDLTAQLGFNYERPISDRLALRFGANAHHISDHYLEVTNAIEIKGYTRYDGFVALVTQDDHWEFKLQGKNLADDVHYVSGIVSFPVQALATLRPRTWSFSVSYRM